MSEKQHFNLSDVQVQAQNYAKNFAFFVHVRDREVPFLVKTKQNWFKYNSGRT